MINIMKKNFKQHKLTAFYYFIGLFLYVWMLAAMFPTMQKVDINKLFEQYPKEFLSFFGAEDIRTLSTFEGFISMEFLSLFFVFILSFFTASSAGGIIAGAIEKKTIDFELSQPIGRTKYVLAKSIVTLFYTILLTTLTSLSISVFALLYDINLKASGLLAFTLIASLFMSSVFAIAVFLSSILKTRLTVASFTVLIVMGFYILTAMSGIVDKMKDFEKFSLFYLYNPQELLSTGNININHIIILLSVFVLGLGSSVLIFNKKDL